MEAGNVILMDITVLKLDGSSEETYFTQMVFTLEVHTQLQQSPLLSWWKHTGPNKFMGTRVFLLDQCHRNKTTSSPSHF